LDGVELEDAGADEEAGANWEKRVMFNDIMTNGYDSEPTVISGITMALLKDTGWYALANSEASLDWTMSWGYNEGCDFLNNVCLTGGSPNFSEFC
jgi:hypothetical protein